MSVLSHKLLQGNRCLIDKSKLVNKTLLDALEISVREKKNTKSEFLRCNTFGDSIVDPSMKFAFLTFLG